MKRIHLFEFEDLAWFPQFFKDAMTDYLQFVTNLFDVYQPIIPLLQKGLDKAKTKRIIDICSGGGGGILKINQALQKVYPEPYQILLTDKYPNIVAFEHIVARSKGETQSSNNISFVETAVDATNVPAELDGLRTQFLSFHHFKPKAAQAILQDAVDKRMPIAVVEGINRKVLDLMMMVLLAPFLVLIFMPFIKPLKASRLIFTYLIPLLPFFIVWDGVVSILRAYTVEELETMAQATNAPNYHWEAGHLAVKGSSGINYLLGYPV